MIRYIQNNIFFLVVLFGVNCFGQDTEVTVDATKSNSGATQSIAPGISVDHYNGILNTSIPIFNYKGKELNCPISLDYSASGLKVDQLAGTVGLGWNLSVGARLNRVIVGAADNVLSSGSGSNCGEFGYDSPSTDLGLKDYYRVNLLGKEYIFKAPIHTYDQVMYPLTDGKSELRRLAGADNTAEYVLTTGDGTQYFFGQDAAREELKSYSEACPNLQRLSTMTWMLTKIISANKMDEYGFVYQSYEWRDKMVDRMNGYYIPNAGNPLKHVQRNDYRINQQVVTLISHNGDPIIGFNYGAREDMPFSVAGTGTKLSEILFYNYKSTQPFRKVAFDYTYFGTSIPTHFLDNRLKLDKITNLGFDSSTQTWVMGDSYSFGYITPELVPSVKSGARDYLGLYNGQDSNVDLMVPPFYRAFDLESAVAGTLNRITYPGGGWAEFEYEQNARKGGYGHQNIPVDPIFHHDYVAGCYGNEIPDWCDPRYYELSTSMESIDVSDFDNTQTPNSIDVLYATTMLLDLAGETSPLHYNVGGYGIFLIQSLDSCTTPNACGTDTLNSCLTDTRDITYNGITTSQPTRFVDGGLTPDVTGASAYSALISPGKYQVTLWTLDTDWPSHDYPGISFYKTWEEPQPDLIVDLDVTSEPLDGFRIKSIVTYTSENQVASKKIYKYSGGYLSDHIDNIKVTHSPGGYSTTKIYSRGYAVEKPVHYCNVFEVDFNGDDEDNGFIKYLFPNTIGTYQEDYPFYYINEAGRPADPMFNSSQNRYDLLIGKQIYNKQEKLVLEESYDHYRDGYLYQPGISEWFFDFWGMAWFPAGGTTTFYPEPGNLANKIVSTKVVETGGWFDQYIGLVNQDGLSTYYDYHFDTYDHYKLAGMTKSNGTGYRHDLGMNTPGFAGIPGLLNGNAVNRFLPRWTDTRKNDNSWEKSMEYEYDSAGNTATQIAYTPGTLTPASYSCTVYGYNDRFAVASIQGLKYSDLPTNLITAIHTQTNNPVTPTNEAAVRTALKNLRDWVAGNTIFPSAKITTTTYNPALGITSQADLSGQSTFYEYDALGRLQYTRKVDPVTGTAYLIAEKRYHTATPGEPLNWTKDIVYRSPATAAIASPTPLEATVSMTYYDGLMRPIQQIAHRQSYDETTDAYHDVKTYIGYDEFGRGAKEYLPYAADNANLVPDLTPDETLAYPEYTDNNPYSEKEYDGSPLNRVMKVAAPGNADDWAMGSGHEIKFEYLLNSEADAVRKLTYNNGAVTEDLAYGPNALFKTVTIDENDNLSQEFKNLRGQLVLKRVINEEQFQDTYYCYDAFDHLVFVSPPLASQYPNIDANVIAGLCYQYKYDTYNRLVEKKLPGKRWEFIVYDKLNRIVATGPAYAPFSVAPDAAAELGWLCSYYDALGRVAYTTWRKDNEISSSSRATLQNSYNAAGVINAAPTTTPTTIVGIPVNYTNADVKASEILLTVNYYDDYNFPHASGINFSLPVLGQSVHYNNTGGTKPTGLPTGSWVRVLESGTVKAETSFILYDKWARPIATDKANYLGGYTKTSSILEFDGQVRESHTRHKRDNTVDSDEIVTAEIFKYYDNGSLKTHDHNSAGPTGSASQRLAHHHYTPLGRLASKDVGTNGSSNRLQEVNYAYNIRGWLTHINDPKQSMGSTDDLFAFRINYDLYGLNGRRENDGDADGVKSLYNGNISQTYWRSADDNILRNYGYTYDDSNRMLDAVYARTTSANPINSYKESATYDANGNILHLERYGDYDAVNNLPSMIDDLTYNYDQPGNRLMGVYDDTASPKGFKDKDLATLSDIDYTYDDFGNMTADTNKRITSITYNHLNLPMEIKVGTHKIVYLYNALGQKLRKAVMGETTDDTDYLDGFQYYKKSLKHFPTAEGYVSPVKTSAGYSFKYVYNYVDHLGNIRMNYSLDTDGSTLKILEENHYYPFGLKHTNYNRSIREWAKEMPQEEIVLKAPPVDPGGTEQPFYKYKYNGQEWQDELALNLFDMDMRDYDPAIGRWTGIDPVTHHDMSPYVGMDNNPVFWADPSGANGIGGIGGETFSGAWGMSVSTPNNLGLYTGYVDNASFGTVGQSVDAFGLTVEKEQILNLNMDSFADGHTFLNFSNGEIIGGGFVGSNAGISVGPIDLGTIIDPPVKNKTLTSKQQDFVDLVRSDARMYQSGLEWTYEDNIFSAIGKQLSVTLPSARFNSIFSIFTKENTIPIGKAANHLFKGAGKLSDTPANRKLIESISNGSSLGIDKYGKVWYARTLSNGKQIYTYTQNGVVKGAGINDTVIDIIVRYGLK